MLLNKNEIKQQTRELWKHCFDDTDDFLDIYFAEKYTDEANLTVRRDGRVVAAAQILPYQLLFYGLPLHSGYLSGLCVHPDQRGKGLASLLVREAHRRLYRQGAALSLLIPGNEKLRHFYERPQHGAYWTATYRTEQELMTDETADTTVEISQPDEWGNELFVAFRRQATLPFMLRPAENDFFAALAVCDRADGQVLVARRRKRVTGICLVAREPDGRIFVRSMWATDTSVRNAFLRHIAPNGNMHIYSRTPAAGTADGAIPYAMARVVNAERFLGTIAAAFPDFSLHIGVDGDLDVPENNGYYRVGNGRVSLTDKRPDRIVTPGGLAALLLAAQPVWAEMLLDE